MQCRVAALLALAATGAAAQTRPVAPPNAPAQVVIKDDSLFLKYDGMVIYEASVHAAGGRPRLRQLVDTTNGVITQVLTWIPGHGRIKVAGYAAAPGNAFAVEAEPREDGVPIVRHAVGAGFNMLNRALYARDRDWLLSFDQPADAHINVLAGGSPTKYTLYAEGAEVTLRFRPRFYQKHRGLARYEPWTYQPWPTSVAGWTSWFAFKDKVTEQDVKRATETVARQLGPYGYTVIQIDDGFQQNPISVPEHWLQTNSKFPNGLPGLQRAITGAGLTAGLWTNTTFADSAWAASHPQYFVRDAQGKPVRGNWVGWVMDGTNPATYTALIDPVYKGLKAQGWTYFKVDALRHLRYEGYNANSGFFAKQGKAREKVYRDFMQRIRDDVGRESFVLASWGPRPELIGLIDATRLGDDGFGYGGFAQFNSFNNVVWRNDPDHIEIHQPDGRRAATIASLTGSLVMLTDKPETYNSMLVDIPRRVAPVPVTHPSQVYDIDPSRSRLLGQVQTEVSGAGPRPFEADQRLQQPLYQLDMQGGAGWWSVLARTVGAPTILPTEELGLMAKENIVFDFWAQQPFGVVRDTLRAPAVGENDVQVLCFRTHHSEPQFLGSNRHVTCGLEVGALSEGSGVIQGRSAIVPTEPYIISVTEPAGYTITSAEAVQATAVLSEPRTAAGITWRTVTISGTQSKDVAWTIRYIKK